MKLISMTDFVLEVKNRCNTDGFKDFSFMSEYQSIFNYSEFLKLSLKLEMFIPLRQDGTIITEPIPRKTSQKRYPYELRDWREAIEKVLFDGFMNVDSRKEGQIYFALKQSHRKNNIDYIMNDAFGLFFFNASNEKSRLNTIEDLLNFHELILTEAAIKQIGI